MLSFDAILFDFDGVLADTEPFHWTCWAEVVKPLGLHLTWDYYRAHCVGIDDRDMLRMMAASADPPRDWEDLWAQYPRKKELFRARTLAAPPFDRELDGWLCGLHRDYKLAVVSSSARSEIDALLAAGGLRRHFDALVCADDVPGRKLKPAPDPYLMAAKQLGAVHPLVVEDSQAGIASGRAAGFEVLPVAGPDRLRETVDERLAVGRTV